MSFTPEIMKRLVSITTNPRYLKARYEHSFIMVPRHHFKVFHAPMPLDAEVVPVRWPIRFETLADYRNKNPVPYFLVTFDDGSTVETF